MTAVFDKFAYTIKNVRKIDETLITKYGIAGFDLMQRAGQFAWRKLLDNYPNIRSLLIFCGPGNNGGDGYILAKAAISYGLQVTVCQINHDIPRGYSSKLAWQEYKKIAIHTIQFDQHNVSDISDIIRKHDLIVDAMLGTGFQNKLSSLYINIIQTINTFYNSKPIIALDIPSGFNADRGYAIDNNSIIAHHTITFIAYKRGMLTGLGAKFCGQIHFSNLYVNNEVYEHISSHRLLDKSYIKYLPKKQANFHKYQCGTILVVGGNVGMAGAAIMAAMAAVKLGAGLVKLVVHQESVAGIVNSAPNLMVYGVQNNKNDMFFVQKLASQVDFLLIGPGLGKNEWAQSVWQVVSKVDKPRLIDADGIGLLAASTIKKHNNLQVITPHSGEAAQLLNQKSITIDQDRFTAIEKIYDLYNAITVLKGPGSLIIDNITQNISICSTGNSSMAVAGMGDILSGIIAGLLSQHIAKKDNVNYFNIVCLAVFLHSIAGDRLKLDKNYYGLSPTVLLDTVCVIINELIF